MLHKILNNYRQNRVSRPESHQSGASSASSSTQHQQLYSSKRLSQGRKNRQSSASLKNDLLPTTQQREQCQGEAQPYEADLFEDKQSRNTNTAPPPPPPSQRSEKEYKTIIEGLQEKICLLLQEVSQLTQISNELMDESVFCREKLQQIQIPSAEQYQSNPPELREIELRQSLEQNKKLERQLQNSCQESIFWREKYEQVQREYECDTRTIKEQLSQKHEAETEALRTELLRLTQVSQTSSLHNSKGNRGSAGGRGTAVVIANKEAQKENLGTTSQKVEEQGNAAVWVQKYLDLKREKEQDERVLMQKIKSLEEQVTYLQLENHQRESVPPSSERQQIQQEFLRGTVRLSSAQYKVQTGVSRGALTSSDNNSPDGRLRNGIHTGEGKSKLHFDELNDYFKRNLQQAYQQV